MSIAGGIYRAVEAAHQMGCDCVQVFTKNNNQWRAKPLTDQDAAKFQAALDELKISHPIAHDSYLINLASPDDELWQKSVDAFLVELQRAEQLRIPYVVAHPGAYTTSDEMSGIRRIAQALDKIHTQTPELKVQCLLETTAGQGSNLGWRFEHLAEILQQVKHPKRLGVCLDTCHVFAAGYPLATRGDYRATMKAFDEIVGCGLIRAFHLNDSQKPLGSRVDRHAHIGQGHIGIDAFRHLLNDSRFQKIPMYLETPKGEDEQGRAWDMVNLETLRNLVKK